MSEPRPAEKTSPDPGSGSGSGPNKILRMLDPDPDPHMMYTDPQPWKKKHTDKTYFPKKL